MITEIHIHTRYSNDSLMTPKTILKIAKRKGIEALAITDHDTIMGALATKRIAEDFGIEIIVGAEIKTDLGDIIGIHLNDEIHTRNWRDVIQEIKMQGGFSILPHPYKTHKNVNLLAEHVDMIEIWNARCSRIENKMARVLQKKYRKKPTIGSDAHTYFEVGSAIMDMDIQTFDLKQIIHVRPALPFEQRASQIIGYIRRKELRKMVKKIELKTFGD